MAWEKQLARFFLVSISGLVLTNLLMFVGVEIVVLHYLIAKIIAVGAVFLWTFIFHNIFSFKPANRSTMTKLTQQDKKKTSGKTGSKASILKNIPIDFGQANLRQTTKGKLIAMSLVKEKQGKKAWQLKVIKSTDEDHEEL